MDVYIQKIRVEWTKESRGEPLASIRAKVPEIVSSQPLPNSGGIQLEEVFFYEVNEFHSPTIKPVKTINEHQLRQLGLEFGMSDETLIIYQWKDHYRKKLTGLRQNQWMRLITNRRHPLEHTSGYYKEVINIVFSEMHKVQDILKTKTYQALLDKQTILY